MCLIYYDCRAQEETQEYAEESKLKELVSTYSQFIDFPIYLYTSKEVEVDAPEEEAAEDEISDAEDVADGRYPTSLGEVDFQVDYNAHFKSQNNASEISLADFDERLDLDCVESATPPHK